jgi:exonuclease V gamma subunit
MLSIGAIQVLQSPDLVVLAQTLRAHLRALRADVELLPPLKLISVVVPDIAIARFLHDQAALAEGIGAGVRYLLLSEWLENEHSAFVGADDETALPTSIWPPHALYLAILAVIEDPASSIELPAAARSDALPVRAQFASKLTQIYNDYLRYRPDWLFEWQQTDSSAEHWQAALWRAVVQRLGPLHRAEIVRQLTYSVRENIAGLRLEPSLLFGFSHLPPAIVELLRQRAIRAPVALYFANPCVEYWADLRCQSALRQPMEDPEFQIDIDHPLLRAWGAHGQAFFRLLLDATDNFYDLSPRIAQADQDLARVQQSLQHLDHDIELTGDASIAVLRASSVGEELVLLKHSIFAALNAMPDLQLEDIVVLCPNLARYQGHIAGCWTSLDAQSSSQTASLPFSVWAEGEQDQHPWLRVLLRMIRADRMRFDRQDMQALLDSESVRAAYQLDHDDAYLLDELLAELAIGFGLDDQHREMVIHKNFDADPDRQQSVVDHSELTWQRQLQRLVLAYVQGATADVDTAQAETEQIETSLVRRASSSLRLSPRYGGVLGALGDLVADLRRFVRQLTIPRTVSQWCVLLHQHFAKWSAVRFDAARGQQVGQWEFAAFGQFQTALSQFEAAATAAQLIDPIPAELVFRFMSMALREQRNDRDARFGEQLARGGVCVSAMVPMRARPFRVVCILGANAEDFPRKETPSDWQLAKAAPRLGDRYLTQDDRYLFLEAINAACDRLIISYQAQSATDGAALAPALMVQQFIEFLSARGWRDPASAPSAQLSVPINERLHAARSTSVSIAHRLPASTPAPVIDLAELVRFWKAPNESYAERRLAIRYRRDRVDRFRDEVLQPELMAAPSAHRRLMKLCMQLPQLPAEAPGFLQSLNVIPQGEGGRSAYQNLRQTHEALYTNLVKKRVDDKTKPLTLTTVFANAVVTPSDASGMLDSALAQSVRLIGPVSNAWPEARMVWMSKLTEISAFDLIEARLTAAALDQTADNLLAPGEQASMPGWRVLLTSAKRSEILVVNGFGLDLATCLAAYQSQDQPIWFWPTVAQAYAKTVGPRADTEFDDAARRQGAYQTLLELQANKGFDSRIAELLFADSQHAADPRIAQFMRFAQQFFGQGILL